MTATSPPDLGDVIRNLRLELGLTQEKFAAQLGVSFPTVNRWENKHAKPSPLALEKIEAMIAKLSKAKQKALGYSAVRK
ncbi:MAG: helix-turn-helix domain-containing protein [Elainellaceae cyanobacterium]